MKIQQRSYIAPQTSKPRFGTMAGASSFEAKLFHVADDILTMHQRAEAFFAPMVKSQNIVIRGVGKFLNGFISPFLDHDYKKMASIPILGRIIADPPVGAFLAVCGFILMGRLHHALARAEGNDRRELRDICFRDLPTFGLVIFAVGPLLHKMGSWLEKKRQIHLLNGQSIFTYSELGNIFRVFTANRLKAILSNTKNHQGMLNAIDNNIQNPSLTRKMTDLFKLFKKAIIEGQHASGDAQLNEASQKAFKLLKALETERSIALKSISSTASVFNGGLVRWVKNMFTAKVPSFNDMFFRYARNTRVVGDAISFALLIGMLGFGVTGFNEWYTFQEFKKKQALLKQQQFNAVNSNPWGAMSTVQPIPRYQTNAFVPATYNGF